MSRLTQITGVMLCIMIFLCCSASAESTNEQLYPMPTLSPDAAPYDSEHPENLEADQLYACSAILIEADSGNVIFEKDIETIRHPASTTKIMTLLLACQIIPEEQLEETVTISPRAALMEDEDAVMMGLQVGEEIRVIDLMYGCAVKSANDAANALAEACAGSVEAFVDLMNQYAQQLGCTKTHFANPHGLTNENHYTTAHDLAIIAREAMKNELFRTLVSTYQYSVPATNVNRRRTITSTNTLFRKPTENSPNKYYREYAIGIKTGTTNAAQYCFVGAAQQEGVELISVVLYGSGPNGIWADTIKLMDYGFSQYTSVTPVDLYNMNPLVIETSGYALEDSAMGKLQLRCVPQDTASASRANIIATYAEVEMMARNLRQTVIINFTRDFAAPVSTGETMGTMTYYAQSGEAVTYNLIATRSVAKRQNAPLSVSEIYEQIMSDPNPFPPLSIEIIITYGILPIVVLALVISLFVYMIRHRRRRPVKIPKVK